MDAINILLETSINGNHRQCRNLSQNYSFLPIVTPSVTSFTKEPRLYIAKLAFLPFPIEVTTMFEPRHNLNPRPPFPRRPPRDPTYYTLRLRDITPTTITTVVKCENGEDKELSCVTLRDLLVESDTKPIPTCIDTAWIGYHCLHGAIVG